MLIRKYIAIGVISVFTLISVLIINIRFVFEYLYKSSTIEPIPDLTSSALATIPFYNNIFNDLTTGIGIGILCGFYIFWKNKNKLSHISALKISEDYSLIWGLFLCLEHDIVTAIILAWFFWKASALSIYVLRFYHWMWPEVYVNKDLNSRQF